MQQRRMRGEVLLDLLSNFVSIHMDGEIAFLAELDCGPRVLVGKPSKIARRADRRVWRGDADVFERGKQLLRRLPHGLVREDKPQNRAVPLNQGALGFADKLIESGKSRSSLGKTTG